MIEIVSLLVIGAFFVWYLIKILSLRGKQEMGEPLWIFKEMGVGIGMNPRNPLGFWLNLLVSIAVLLVIVVMIVFITFEGL